MQEPRFERLRRWMLDRDITFRDIGEQLGISSAGARGLLIKETIGNSGHYDTLLRLGFPKDVLPYLYNRQRGKQRKLPRFPGLENSHTENAANEQQ